MADRWTSADIPDQRGRTVLITGANSGLGLRAAESLAANGARVLLACRNPERAEVARAEVARVAGGPAPEVALLDVADLDDVAAVGRRLADELDHLDVLMNNAGIMAIPKTRSAQGHELQLATNHLGHFALTAHLLPTLLRAEAPRVISVASSAHRFGAIRFDDPNWERGRYNAWRSYGQTKLANLLFTSELQRRSTEHGSRLLAAAAHPGYAVTNLGTARSPGGNSVTKLLIGTADRLFGQSDLVGALPQLYAATMPDVLGDDYWGPDGFMEQRGHPTRVSRSSRAKDADAARRLWTLSEELTGVTYDWPRRPAT